MTSRPRLLFQEEFSLNSSTPRSVRARVGSFAPLLGDSTRAVQQAASEIATAFARHDEAEGTLDFRLLANEHFRVEFSNSLGADDLEAGIEKLGEQFLRRTILDSTTDSWGVVGDGAAIVWFEVVPTRRPFSQSEEGLGA